MREVVDTAIGIARVAGLDIRRIMVDQFAPSKSGIDSMDKKVTEINSIEARWINNGRE